MDISQQFIEHSAEGLCDRLEEETRQEMRNIARLLLQENASPDFVKKQVDEFVDKKLARVRHEFDSMLIALMFKLMNDRLYLEMED